MSKYINKVSNDEFIRILNKNNYTTKMNKYDISEIIKNKFLISHDINPITIMQGFAFEGINGELAYLDGNYAVAIETLGLINYIPTIKKVKQVNGHLGYSMDGIPISLRDVFKWLDNYQTK